MEEKRGRERAGTRNGTHTSCTNESARPPSSLSPARRTSVRHSLTSPRSLRPELHPALPPLLLGAATGRGLAVRARERVPLLAASHRMARGHDARAVERRRDGLLWGCNLPRCGTASGRRRCGIVRAVLVRLQWDEHVAQVTAAVDCSVKG